MTTEFTISPFSARSSRPATSVRPSSRRGLGPTAAELPLHRGAFWAQRALHAAFVPLILILVLVLILIRFLVLIRVLVLVLRHTVRDLTGKHVSNEVSIVATLV